MGEQLREQLERRGAMLEGHFQLASGRHADTYALCGETHAQVAELIGRVRAAAAPHGRAPRFSLSVRPILAETEARAWERAEDILARTRAVRAARGLGPAATPRC